MTAPIYLQRNILPQLGISVRRLLLVTFTLKRLRTISMTSDEFIGMDTVISILIVILATAVLCLFYGIGRLLIVMIPLNNQFKTIRLNCVALSRHNQLRLILNCWLVTKPYLKMIT